MAEEHAWIDGVAEKLEVMMPWALGLPVVSRNSITTECADCQSVEREGLRTHFDRGYEFGDGETSPTDVIRLRGEVSGGLDQPAGARAQGFKNDHLSNLT